VLGFTRRRDPSPSASRTPWRDRSASSYEAPLAATDLQLGRAAQLPPFGRGNGIDALFWTPLARLAPERIDPVLDALRSADIAAWVAPVRGTGAGEHDLWVASLGLDAAQDVLMQVVAGG
jgi:hypothetical protein